MAEAEVESAVRDITESVQLACYEIWFATQAIAISESNRELLKQLVAATEARYRAGGSQQDVIRAELEV